MPVDRLSLGLSGGGILAFCVAASASLSRTQQAVAAGSHAVATTMGFGWQVLMVAIAAVAVVLAASPRGRTRYGDTGRRMSTFRWVSVLMCTLLAGGGVFWSAGEPMYHFLAPPPAFTGVEAGSPSAAAPAMAQCHLHWGFLAWSSVGTLGAIVLLRLHHVRGLPLQPRTLLVPVIGERAAMGRFGSVVDGACVVAAVAGTVGPIGFLGLQLAYAANHLFGLPDGYGTQLAVIVALTAVATISAVSGIKRGIEVLSRLNIALTLLLAAGLLLLGPTGFLLETFATGMRAYASHLPQLAFSRTDGAWLETWTVFYWGWFLGYAPVMSIFVARISAGRTLREIVFAVAVLAPLATHLWFTVLGGTGLFLDLQSPGSISAALETAGLPAALFAIVELLPLGQLFAYAFVLLIFLFLATSADSIAYSVSMIVSADNEPSRSLRAFWGISMGVAAAFLVSMGNGGVTTLQQAIVVSAVPASLVMATTIVGVWRKDSISSDQTDGPPPAPGSLARR